MNKPINIKVPAFIDDQLTGGRRMVFSLISFMFGGRASITIQNGILTYKESSFASSPSKSFDLSNISKLLVVRTHYSSTKDFSLLNYSSHWSFYLELFLINKNKGKHLLIPSFIDIENIFCRWEWEKFLDELKMFTCLPLEMIEIKANNKDVK
jgi:hypothetical protein